MAAIHTSSKSAIWASLPSILVLHSRASSECWNRDPKPGAEQKYRPLAGWVRDLVNVKHLYTEACLLSGVSCKNVSPVSLAGGWGGTAQEWYSTLHGSQRRIRVSSFSLEGYKQVISSEDWNTWDQLGSTPKAWCLFATGKGNTKKM